MTVAEDRKSKALELHLAGATYDSIAKAIGYASRSGAHKAVQEALDDIGRPAPLAAAIETEIARLDAMLTGLWPKARRGDLPSVDRALKISGRRTQLLAQAGSVATDTTSTEEEEGTGLSEFERRLRDRESASAAVRRAEG